MNSTKRYSSKNFPEYVFVPGLNPHPKKKGGHMEGESDPVTPPIKVPEENEFFRYAIDLFNYEYYWESHVYFEALWNAHQRVGYEADFFKALIKLGAGGLKDKLQQAHYAREHYLRAKELLQNILENEGEIFFGINLNLLIQDIDEYLEAKTPRIFIFPEWD